MNSSAKHFLKRGATDEYCTPSTIVAALGSFTLDPCASKHTHHADVNWTKKDNGLSRDWRGRVFLNPPYSYPLIEQFTEKFIVHGNGIALVLARTGTKWFQKLAASSDAIFLLQGRIKFYKNCKPTTSPAMDSVFLAIGKYNVIKLQKLEMKGILFYGNSIK